MMLHQDLQEIIHDFSDIESYILFRQMEEWCYENLHLDSWKLDWSSTICVYGVDIPSRIIFNKIKDLETFKLIFVMPQIHG